MDDNVDIHGRRRSTQITTNKPKQSYGMSSMTLLGREQPKRTVAIEEMFQNKSGSISSD